MLLAGVLAHYRILRYECRMWRLEAAVASPRLGACMPGDALRPAGYSGICKQLLCSICKTRLWRGGWSDPGGAGADGARAGGRSRGVCRRRFCGQKAPQGPQGGGQPSRQGCCPDQAETAPSLFQIVFSECFWPLLASWGFVPNRSLLLQVLRLQKGCENLRNTESAKDGPAGS